MTARNPLHITIPLEAAVTGQQAASTEWLALALGVFSNLFGLEAKTDGRTARLTFNSAPTPDAVQIYEFEATKSTPNVVHDLPDGGSLRAWVDDGGLNLAVEPGWSDLPAPPPVAIDDLKGRLPSALTDAIDAHSAAGNPLMVAGIAARHALQSATGEMSGVRDPLVRRVIAWWEALESEPGQRDAQEGFAEAVAFALLLDAEAVLDSGTRMGNDELERLALRRDDLASVCSFLHLVGAGRGAREVQPRIDRALRSIYAAHTGATFASPHLATVASYGAGWWAVAPGAVPPAPAADAWEPALDDDLAWAEELDAELLADDVQ